MSSDEKAILFSQNLYLPLRTTAIILLENLASQEGFRSYFTKSGFEHPEVQDHVRDFVGRYFAVAIQETQSKLIAQFGPLNFERMLQIIINELPELIDPYYQNPEGNPPNG